MSAAEHPSSNSSQSAKSSIRKPLKRPALRQPPSRSSEPKPLATEQSRSVPATPVAQKSSPPVTEKEGDSSAKDIKQPPGLHPISAPSEPMQYRAIGLVRGTYTPEAEQLNRGCLLTDEGIEIDSVLLGRVTSLIKNHINLESSHLWVVYPRTREAEGQEGAAETDLHLQIVGVWEPETLGMPGESRTAEESDKATSEAAEIDVSTEASVSIETEATASDEAVAAPDAADSQPDEIAAVEAESPAAVADSQADSQIDADSEAESVAIASPSGESSAADQDLEDPAPSLPSENYFSIRGEVLKGGEDTDQILIKIVQGAKRSDKAPKAFKVHVYGQITGKTVGYFWELDVERKGKLLTLVEGRTVGIVPPKKNKKRKGPPGKFKRQFNKGGRPVKSGPPQPKTKPRIRPSAPVKSNPL